ncbi:MAG: AMIN domain-containing protein [Desulfopila sp.]|nr:AMIN domain-containing protein [Desulfopila sp.]
MKFRLPLFFLLVAFLVPGIVLDAGAKNAEIESVRFLKKDGIESVEVKMNTVIFPEIFQLSGEKPRIVCDFQGVRYSAKKKMAIEGGNGLIRQIRIGLHFKPTTKTRVVIDLSEDNTFVIDRQVTENGKTLVLQVVRQAEDPQKDIAAVVGKDGIQSESREMVKSSSSVSSLESPPVESQTDVVSTSSDEVAHVSFQGDTDVSQESAGEIGKGEDDDFAEVVDEDIPVLLNVSYERSTNDKEMVLFRLSGFHPPLVFSRESEDLLVVCDFLDAILGYGIEPSLQTKGKYIQQVRVVKMREPDKVRVILDLVGGFNYELKQVFFREDNLFVIIISSLGKKEG